MQVFETVDTKRLTLVYDRDIPSSHKLWFLKTHDNRVWEEREYAGDAVFANKNYFVLLAEINMTPSRLAKCKYSAEELGRKIYYGNVKLVKLKAGNTIDIEIKYPEVCEDDERPWKNRKPVYSLVEELEYEVLEDACECDWCCRECE